MDNFTFLSYKCVSISLLIFLTNHSAISLSANCSYYSNLKKKTKLRGLSPRANYTDLVSAKFLL
jgi:hypothetical protein